MKRKQSGTTWRGILSITIILEVVALGATFLLSRLWGFGAADGVALGQLIVALLLIPLAVVAFWQARHALAEAGARPSLRIAFLGEDGLLHDEYTLRLPGAGQPSNRVTLAVENLGDAIAVWWQVTFDIPLEMIKLLRLGNGNFGVTQRYVPVTMDTVNDVERYVAQSSGTTALFPGPPVQVAAFQASLDPDFQPAFNDSYPIRYELLTDRSSSVTGVIPLAIVEES